MNQSRSLCPCGTGSSYERCCAIQHAGLPAGNAELMAADSAEVEFIARSRIGPSTKIRHHERSRFVREGGFWLYVDGVVT